MLQLFHSVLFNTFSILKRGKRTLSSVPSTSVSAVLCGYSSRVSQECRHGRRAKISRGLSIFMDEEGSAGKETWDEKRSEEGYIWEGRAGNGGKRWTNRDKWKYVNIYGQLWQLVIISGFRSCSSISLSSQNTPAEHTSLTWGSDTHPLPLF